MSENQRGNTAAAVIISVAPFSALLHIFGLENISLLKKFFFTRLHQILVLACGTFFFFFKVVACELSRSMQDPVP